MPKSNSFRTNFRNERIHRSQTLPKSGWQQFYTRFPLIRDKLSWKTCVSIRSKILGLFVNTLTPVNMYCPHNWEKFPQQLQRQICQKGKIISGIFNSFFKDKWNFLFLEEKDQLHSLNISEVIDCEKYSYLNVKRQLFQNNLRETAHSQVPNTAQISMAALLSQFCITPRQTELKNMPLNQIENLGTFWKHIEKHVGSTVWKLLIFQRNCNSDFKGNYLKKGKQFLEFSIHFRNLH